MAFEHRPLILPFYVSPQWIFTALLTHESRREYQTRDVHTFTPPLGGVNICREHLYPHEPQRKDALLSVNETSAREDGLPKTPAGPFSSQPNRQSAPTPNLTPATSR